MSWRQVTKTLSFDEAIVPYKMDILEEISKKKDPKKGLFEWSILECT